MDHKSADDLLPLYFDGELDRAIGREFEAHLDTCAECRTALIELDALRRSLREGASRFAAPELLRRRIQKLAATLANANSRTRMMRTNWFAMAASWVLAFAAGGFAISLWHAPQSARESSASTAQNQITRDLFASHWRALAATSPVDVVSTDRHTVKPWFEGKINDAPIVQDFAEQGFALVGGRIDYVGTQRVPVLVYRHGQHLIDVFVLPQTDASATCTQAKLQGYSLQTAKLGDQSAVVISDMDQTELARFVQLVGTAK